MVRRQEVSKWLTTLKIDWNTNTVTLKPKAYKLEYFDKHSGLLKIIGEETTMIQFKELYNLTIYTTSGSYQIINKIYGRDISQMLNQLAT